MDAATWTAIGVIATAVAGTVGAILSYLNRGDLRDLKVTVDGRLTQLLASKDQLLASEEKKNLVLQGAADEHDRVKSEAVSAPQKVEVINEVPVPVTVTKPAGK